MPLPLLIESELDERSASAAATRAERMWSEASRDIARDLTTQVGGAFQDVSRDADKMATDARSAFNRMNDAGGEVARTQREIADEATRTGKVTEQAARDAAAASDKHTDSIRDATIALGNYETAARRAGDEAKSSFGGLGSSLKGIGGEAADGFAEGFGGSSKLLALGTRAGPVGIALAGLAAVGYAAGSELVDQIEQGMAANRIQDVFQARLGLDDASARTAGQAAADSFTAGYGESVEANLQSTQVAMQGGLLPRDAGQGEIAQVNNGLQTIASTFNVDVQAAARAAGQLMRTGFAGNATQALDIVTSGFQRGLDMSGDWLDTLNEYSTQFRKLGLDGGDALGLLQQGLQGGARDTDVVADSLKEFSIRAVDGSKTTADGFAALGFNADDMARRISVGGDSARTAFGATVDALKNLGDPYQQAMAWQSLFGTQWEDMGDAINNLDLSKAKNEFGDVDTSLANLNTKINDQASQWDLVGRNIDTTFSKMKQWLADSDIGKFFGQGIPSFLNGFFEPPSAPVAGTSAPNSTAPVNPLDILAPPGAPGAPSAGGPGSLLLPSLTGPPPPPGAPGAPGAPPVPGARTPILSDTEQEKKKADEKAAKEAEKAAKEAAKEAEKAAKEAAKNVDPSLYSLSSVPIGSFPGSTPIAGAPGASTAAAGMTPGMTAGPVDPEKVFDANTTLLSAQTSVENARKRVIEMQQEGTKTEAEIQVAKNQVIVAERNYQKAQRELAEAQMGLTGKLTDSVAAMKGVFAPLADDFGISGGLPGIAENLVKIFGNLALGSAIGSNPAWRDSILSDLAAERAATSTAAGTPGGAGLAQTSYSTATAVGTPVLAAPGQARPGESARDFAHRVEQPRFQAQGLTVGDHAADKYGEHQNGALDIMVPSIEAGQKVLAQVLADPNTYGAIFNRTSYGYGRGANGTPMEDRGSPTQNHQDHVHAFFKPGGENNINPGGAAPPAAVYAPSGTTSVAPTSSGFSASGGTQSVFVVNMPSGGFAPGAGGPAAAGAPGDPSATVPTPPGGGIPPVSSGVGTGPAPGPTGWGPGGLPTTGGGGQAFGAGLAPGMAGRAAGAGLGADPITPSMGTGVAFPGSPGGGGGGGGDGGLAGMAAGMFPGGATAAKLATRAVEFGAQAVGIGVSGLMQTFLPAGSERAMNGWAGKLAGGLSGARPSKPNIAGGQAPNVKPGQGGQGGGQPGTVDQSQTNNVTVNNQRATEDGTGRDVQNHLTSMHQAPGP